MKNTYGICEWYLAINGVSAILSAAETGYTGIQIGDQGGITRGFPLLDNRIQEQYLKAADENGIEIYSYQVKDVTETGGLKCPIDVQEGSDAVLSFDNGLKICQEMRIPTIMVASFGASNFQTGEEMKNTAEMLKLFTKMSQHAGIQLAYESFTTTDKLEWMLEYAGEGIKLCFDTLNPIRFQTGDPAEELKRLGIGMIDHVHVKDAPEDMVGSCLLGEGYGKVGYTLAMLKHLGYSGWYFAENYFYLPPMNKAGMGLDLAKKDLDYLIDICEN